MMCSESLCELVAVLKRTRSSLSCTHQLILGLLKYVHILKHINGVIEVFLRRPFHCWTLLFKTEGSNKIDLLLTFESSVGQIQGMSFRQGSSLT